MTYWQTLPFVLLANAIVVLSIVVAWEAFVDLQKLRDPPLDAKQYWQTFLLYAAAQLALWAVVFILYYMAYGGRHG